MMPLRDDGQEQLTVRLRAWRRHGIHVGLFPRVSPFWSGLLPAGPRGAVGRYARLFDTAIVRAGGGADRLRRMRAEAGEGFLWTILLDDEQMIYRFPCGHPDRGRRGRVNGHFLDPAGVAERIAPSLRLLDPPSCVVLLKIGPVFRTEALDFGGFLRALERCLEGLPAGCRYAVENCTPRFVLPDYLACLGGRDVICVPSCAPLYDALRAPGALGTETSLLRSACLAREEDGEGWAEFRDAVRLCLEEGKTLYAYLTDGGEAAGSAQRGAGARRLARLLATLDPELALRSPIRRKAA